MKAVIISAGMGSRLSRISGEVPKPLTPVAGVPLLERIIRVCREAGVKDFGLVVGYRREALMEHFGRGKKMGVKIDYIVNLDWEKGNGLSAYKAEEFVREENSFLLLMSDHLFNKEMIEDFLCDNSPANLLAVDRNINGIFDLDDATKVRCQGTRILDIGKNIADYQGIDCGMFRLKANFFRALEKALEQGQDQLSQGVKELIKMEDFKAHFISPQARWLDVDTEEALHYAEGNIGIYEE